MRSKIHLPRLPRPASALAALVAAALGAGSVRGVAQPPRALPRIQLSEVMDTRQKDGRSLLSVGLDLSGVPRGAERLRVIVRSAADDRGANLRLPLDLSQPGFGWEQGLVENGRATPGAEMLLPPRGARLVARLQGEVQMLLPGRDPDASLVLKDWRKYLGRPLPQGALKRNGIAVRMLSSAQFRALTPRQRAEAGGGLSDVVGTSGGTILFVLRDERRKLAGVQFQKPGGGVIEPRTYGYDKDRMLFTFERPLPPGTRLRLLIATRRAVVKVPFSFSDIPLP